MGGLARLFEKGGRGGGSYSRSFFSAIVLEGIFDFFGLLAVVAVASKLIYYCSENFGDRHEEPQESHTIWVAGTWLAGLAHRFSPILISMTTSIRKNAG